MATCTWKTDWRAAEQRFAGWWQRQGVLFCAAAFEAATPADTTPVPPLPADIRARFEDTEWRAQHEFATMGKRRFNSDAPPMADSDIGPGSLALALGCEPHFSEYTVWYTPAFQHVSNVDELPPLSFDPQAYWWQVHEAQLRRHREMSQGRYLLGMPDLIENIDILAALRDPQTLMIDMLDNPAWVERSVREINQAYFAAYDRLYEIIRNADGSSAWRAFGLWGPGRIAKVQCDASSMLSPQMFRDFVVPALTEQCAWLDHSMYHLDGTQCMVHLDALLEIEPLDAIQWTPQAGMPKGSDPCWFPLYKRVLDAGKSVHVGTDVEDIDTVLGALGTNGIYLSCWVRDRADLEEGLRIVDRWRG